MFPTTGQGACQSLEDAAALGIVLSELKCKSDLATRLQTFQKLRHDRVMAVHTMSSVLVGQETRISEKCNNICLKENLFPDLWNTWITPTRTCIDHVRFVTRLISKVRHNP